MKSFEAVQAAFQKPCGDFMRSRCVQRLAARDLTVKHYAEIMRQIFHQARENPQLQVLAAVRLRGQQRNSVAPFFRHALSEIGHDTLALNDYVACGGKVTGIPIENPLPATTAVTAFAFHQVNNGNPVGYLGYLFFLEFLPTTQGGSLMQGLRAAGVPENAFTFLQDHITVDMGHNKAMEKYCSELIVTQSDLDAVVYALRATGYLYTQMINAAVDSADSPEDFGVNHTEILI
jgi:Iron-containing redox enzyme